VTTYSWYTIMSYKNENPLRGKNEMNLEIELIADRSYEDGVVRGCTRGCIYGQEMWLSSTDEARQTAGSCTTCGGLHRYVCPVNSRAVPPNSCEVLARQTKSVWARSLHCQGSSQLVLVTVVSKASSSATNTRISRHCCCYYISSSSINTKNE